MVIILVLLSTITVGIAVVIYLRKRSLGKIVLNVSCTSQMGYSIPTLTFKVTGYNYTHAPMCTHILYKTLGMHV